MADHSLVLETHYEESLPDPDRPTWGPAAGIGVWIFSFIALFVMSLLMLGVWYGVEAARGLPLPKTEAEFRDWVISPGVVLSQVLSTVLAHALTIAVCWAVVTQIGRRPFWESLGWKWNGGTAWSKTFYVLGVTAVMYFSLVALSNIIPKTSETLFDQLLKTSREVRYAIAFMAVCTAPFVEEIVYRGVLFSALRNRVGSVATIAFVTLLFAGVHVYQYAGDWGGLMGLTLLSLALTLVRAKTKSIFPCVAIHLAFNSISAISIIFASSS